MNNKVYIVTSGEYSDYVIERVFLDKQKAEAYVRVCEKSKLEEYEVADQEIFIPINYLLINYTSGYFNMRGYTLHTTNTVDDPNIFNWTSFSYYKNYYEISLKRIIYTKEYDAEKLGEKYLKVCEDLKTQIDALLQLEGWTPKMIEEWLKTKIPESE